MTAEEVALALSTVRESIARIEQTAARHKEAQDDPSADSDDRGAAREAHLAALFEIGWQWMNVKALLDHFAPVKT